MQRIFRPGAGRREDVLATIMLILIYLALFSGHYYSLDGMTIYHEARSIFYDHSLTFREPLQWGPAIETSKYGIGLSLAYLPGLALAAGLNPYVHQPQRNFDFDRLYIDPVYSVGGAPVHILATAATAYLIARMCRRLGLGRAAALWSMLLFGLGSPALIYARGDFTQPLISLTWMGALYAALGFRQSGSWRAAGWCAASVGYAVLTRPLEGALLAPAALLVALPHLRIARYTRREWLAGGLIALGCGLGLAITVLVNDARYGQWFATGYINEGFYNPLGRGLRGLLVSPARGLVWAFPALILAPLGLWALWRLGQRHLALALAGLIVALVWSMARWFMWWGGGNWGPRLILPSLPLLAVLAGAALATIQARWRPWAAGFLLLAGCAWSLPGVLTDLLAGYSVLVDGNLGSFKGEGVPLIGAWRYVDHALATSLLDNQTIDILWLRLARTTHGLSLIPPVLFLGGALALAWRLLRRPQDLDAEPAREQATPSAANP
jgi:hypothetical protein